MIRFDPTLVDMTSNWFWFVFFICTNVKDYLYNYSYWVELSMLFMKERVKVHNKESHT